MIPQPEQLLQPGVYGFAFQGEDSEDALVDAAQRLAADEPLQALDSKGELAERQGALAGQAARTEPLQVFGGGVVRAVDDPQVLPPPALDGGLHQAARAARDEVQRLDHHALAAPARQFLPPGDALGHAGGVRDGNDLVRRREQQAVARRAQAGEGVHVP